MESPQEPEPQAGAVEAAALDGQALTPLARLLRTTGAWAVMVAAGPGLVWQEGEWLVVCLGLGLWTVTVLRPLGPRPRRALLAEWLAHSLGGCGIFAWFAYVLPASLLWVGGGFGLYLLGAAALLRRLHARLPLALALPFAWTSVEALRALVPLPLGAPWLRLGHHADWGLLTSARLWGVEGVGFVLAFATGLALTIYRMPRPGFFQRRFVGFVGAWMVGHLIVAGVALPSVWVAFAETRFGPLVLLVQPAFTQERRRYTPPEENYPQVRRLTAEALASLKQEGLPEPDLVVWGESMTYLNFATEELEEALKHGPLVDSWGGSFLPEYAPRMRLLEREWIEVGLFDPVKGVGMPPGTWFLGGGETYFGVDGELRRKVSMVLFDPDGKRVGYVSKKHLAPGGETMFGLERIGPIRELLIQLAGYVPNLLPGEGGVLEITTRKGETWAFDVGLCYDNGYLDPFLPGVSEREPFVDFHLVGSNEAWFRGSHEMDQMVAFSKMIAVSTGRPFVRATNSGVSLVIEADGREKGRVEGRLPGSGDPPELSDRSVPGFKLFHLRVPEDRGYQTPYVRYGAWIRGLALALGLAAFLPRRKRA